MRSFLGFLGLSLALAVLIWVTISLAIQKEVSPVAALTFSHPDRRTFSNLREVTGKARQEEIARMLGGKSELALKLASTLLKE